MRIDGKPYRTIWMGEDPLGPVKIIDQRRLPHRLEIIDLETLNDAVVAIRDMAVRGAPLIGATGAFGVYLALRENGAESLENAVNTLKGARPTAVNLAWGVDRVAAAVRADKNNAVIAARDEALEIVEEDVEICRNIGVNGLALIEKIANRKSGPVNILTHCNAGWLATIDWGTATSPIYHAHQADIPVHVWVDETRPRNQGASLTAFELGHENVPHTVIVDNAGGHLMQHGKVDLVIVGTDRTTATGDVANKIGTYLKALAAYDNGVPFYVGLPSSTIDWQAKSGFDDIPIEERDEDEVHVITGLDGSDVRSVRITPLTSAAANPAFDVTPARLVTGLITERGIAEPNEQSIASLFPDKATSQ